MLCASASAYGRNLEQQLSLRTFSGYIQNPRDRDLYPADSDVDQQVILRDSLKYHLTKNIKFELNVYNLLIGASNKTSLSQTYLNASDETNRTPDLERHWRNGQNADAYFTIDRINIRAQIGKGDLTLGRMPINLTSMFIFTPNDFFAPFRPFDYYREYKPGVDAIRYDHSLGKSGQISVLGVAGYDTPALTSRTNSDPPPSRNFSPTNASAIARVNYTYRRFESTLIGGKLGPYYMGGFNLQGELGPIGVRAEGNQRVIIQQSQQQGQQDQQQPSTKPLQQIASIAAGLDYRLTQKLAFSFEQFYNGAGYTSPNDYLSAQANPNPSSMMISRDYTGVIAQYDITGLLNMKALAIINDDDQSVLGNLYLIYSVASNAQLVIALMSPQGKPPDQLAPKSEFGAYPGVLSVQMGVYF
jgi:hypothetical protein